MVFTLADIGTTAGRFLGVLDREEVRSLDDMRTRVGRTFETGYVGQVLFDRKEHKFAKPVSTSYIASYVMGSAGIPIEVRVNDSGFAIVILKAERLVEGYGHLFPGRPFSDNFGNLYQNVENRNAGFDWVVEELQKLKRLAG
ncbi:MAG: hypothetical protein PHF67_01175 [Candidatus Nanoarchaeia archaeon]|nr:hypothetical protein [Candidatus Nanoarchaeia archaeon]